MSDTRYTLPARLMHWLTVALVLAIAVLGIWITRFEPADEPFKFKLYNIHESLGIVVLLLMLARLAWRRASPPPPLPDSIAPPARLAAHVVHIGLYAVLIAQPVIGFIGTNAWGFPLAVFGVIPLPAPVGQNVPLAEVMSALHNALAIALAGLLAAHLGGVAMHVLVWRDGLARRMM